MKIAILILCHKNPKQINLLLDKLNHQDIDCYIHIDKKRTLRIKLQKEAMSFCFRMKNVCQLNGHRFQW